METGSLHSIPAIDKARLGSYQIAILTICALIAMIDGFDTQSIALVAPDIARAWGLPIASFGPVFGIGLFGAMIGGLIAGGVSDRFGRKPSLLISMLVFGAGSLAMPFVVSMKELLIIRLITGLGLGGAMPSFMALASEFTPRRIRATLISAMFCGFPFGASIGAAASTWALAAYGWRSIFVVGGVIPLILLPIVALVVPESLRFLQERGKVATVARIMRRLGLPGEKPFEGLGLPGGEPGKRLFGALFTQGRMAGTLLLWVTFFLSLLLSYFLVNWIPSVTKQAGLMTEGAVGAVAVLNIGGIIGCICISWFVERVGPYQVIGLGYGIGAVAIATIGSAGSSLVAAFISVFIAGFFSIGAQMCVVALAAVYYPLEIRGTGIGWTMGVGRVGAVVGPVVGGLLIGAGVSSQGLFIVAALPSLLAGVAILTMGWLQRANVRSITAHAKADARGLV
jgi:MFS transporter, AAHS family, 4-hydroxybenzoate transporter